MDGNAPYVANLVNSIIGVSVLAMPYCMKKCGLLLGLALLLGASWLTYVSCSMLITSAVMKRRRTYEYLAYHTLGPSGKLVVELSMIGLMLGTCVAFYVIIGDLATGVFASYVDASEVQLRTFVIVFCALCIALPLGLMKNLSVLGKIGFLSLMFYFLFLLVMFFNAVSNGFLTFEWISKVQLFNPEGIFQSLPIFSLAYACQCQLFVVYDALEDPTVMRMESIVTQSLKLVTTVYCLVAIFGYATFDTLVQGNVLQNLPHTILLEIIKFGFAGSVVVGFPLMIFPCRQSIYTLFFKQQNPVDGVASKTYIEPFTFKVLTLCIVLSTMTVAIFIPNVETILGLTGATMGSLICFVLPAVIYSKAYTKSEDILPKFVFILGCLLLVVCTYQNLTALPETKPDIVKPELDKKLDDIAVKNNIEKPPEDQLIPNINKAPPPDPEEKVQRKEPPNPIEPIFNEPVESEKKEPGAQEEVKQPVVIDKNKDGPDSKDDDSSKNEPAPGDKKIETENKPVNNIQQPVENLVKKDAQAVAHDDAKDTPKEIPQKNHHLEEEPPKKEEDSHNDHQEEKQANDQESKEDLDDKVLLEKIKEQHKIQHELLEEQHKVIEQLERNQHGAEEKAGDPVKDPKAENDKKEDSVVDVKQPAEVQHPNQEAVKETAKEAEKKPDPVPVNLNEKHHQIRDDAQAHVVEKPKTGEKILEDTKVEKKHVEDKSENIPQKVNPPSLVKVEENVQVAEKKDPEPQVAEKKDPEPVIAVADKKPVVSNEENKLGKRDAVKEEEDKVDEKKSDEKMLQDGGEDPEKSEKIGEEMPKARDLKSFVSDEG